MFCDIMKETKFFLEKLFNNNDTIVIACSGGPDSMCLLNLVNSYKEEYNLKIICAHVNHGLRKESDEEKEFVKEYCKKNNIIFEYFKITEYKNNKFSESEARLKRYKFFDNTMLKYNAKYLMTAHHGDDLTETILMRIVRGSNLKGYIGISKILENNNYKIVRPLLNLSKDMIYKYLEENNISYVIDKSNESEKYTRNRYRKHVLPFLKNEDNNVHLKFLKYSEEIEGAYKYINTIVKDKIKDIYVENYIVINKLLEEDKYIQEKIIEYVIEDIQKSNIFDISDMQLNSIFKLINSNNNKEINLSNGFIARKSYNKLFFEKNINSGSYEFVFKNNLTILNKYHFERIDYSNEKSNFVMRINSKEIKLPIIIRSRVAGDKIKIKNLNGTKKLKDVFIESKLDNKKREEYPVVCDSDNNIIWVPGIKKSIFDKEINEKYDIIIKYVEGEYE